MLVFNHQRKSKINDGHGKCWAISVREIKKIKVGARKGDEVLTGFTLRFKDNDEDPRTEVPVFNYHWFARYSNCRLERAGPPNQLFFGAGQKKESK